MCAYPSSQHALPHWKCVLSCCENFPCIDLTYQELNQFRTTACPTIRFFVYNVITWCKVHCQQSLENKTNFVCVHMIMSLCPMQSSIQ